MGWLDSVVVAIRAMTERERALTVMLIGACALSIGLAHRPRAQLPQEIVIENPSAGILGLSAYFPSYELDVVELEKAHGVAAGSYSSDLGQQRVSVAGDCENAVTMALTAIKSLLESTGVQLSSIGRLDVAMEEDSGRTRSISSIIQSEIFGHGACIESNVIIDGLQSGVSALFNAVRWSAREDDKLAVLVVIGDHVNSSSNPESPTAGHGAVAMLIGRNAPLVIDIHSRVSFSSRAPSSSLELDSVTCMQTIGNCFSKFKSQNSSSGPIDFAAIHTPNGAFAHRALDSIKSVDGVRGGNLCKHLSVQGNDAVRYIGDTRAANLFMNLTGVIEAVGEGLEGKNILVTSLSGPDSCVMFLLRARAPSSSPSSFSLRSLQRQAQLKARLVDREPVNLEFLQSASSARAAIGGEGKCFPLTPRFTSAGLFGGTYFIRHIDVNGVLSYDRKPLTDARVPQAALKVEAASAAAAAAQAAETGDAAPSAPSLRRNSRSFVWASGRPTVNIVVSGVAAALPRGAVRGGRVRMHSPHYQRREHDSCHSRGSEGQNDREERVLVVEGRRRKAAQTQSSELRAEHQRMRQHGRLRPDSLRRVGEHRGHHGPRGSGGRRRGSGGAEGRGHAERRRAGRVGTA